MTHVSRTVVNPVNLVRQGLPFPLLHSQTGQGQIARRHPDTASDTGCPAGSEIPGKNILKPLLISVPDQTDDLCFPLIQKLLQQMGPEKAGGACEKYGVFLLMNWPRCRYLPGIGRFYFFFLLSCAACEQSRLRPGRGIFVKPGMVISIPSLKYLLSTLSAPREVPPCSKKEISGERSSLPRITDQIRRSLSSSPFPAAFCAASGRPFSGCNFTGTGLSSLSAVPSFSVHSFLRSLTSTFRWGWQVGCPHGRNARAP